MRDEADQRLGLTTWVAECCVDRRHPASGEPSGEALAAQRLQALAHPQGPLVCYGQPAPAHDSAARAPDAPRAAPRRRSVRLAVDNPGEPLQSGSGRSQAAPSAQSVILIASKVVSSEFSQE